MVRLSVPIPSIDKYRIIRELGRGGMGCVYLGYDEDIKRYVAIKVLHPQYAVVPEHVERLRTEAQAPNIVNHPGVVKIDRIEQLTDKSMFLVMEYIEGETLTERMKSKEPPWTEYDAIPIITQLASILSAAHRKSIIHRDIKPSNIMLVQDEEAIDGERVKLLDFGIALLAAGLEAASKRTTKTGQMVGSPRYMSPEQCRGSKNVDGKADVYSLGVLLYELFTGKPPFEGTPADVIAKHLYEPVHPLNEVVPHLSSKLTKAIHAMLEKDPPLRPDIDSLLRDFREIRRDLRGSLSSISALASLANSAELQSAKLSSPAAPPPNQADDEPAPPSPAASRAQTPLSSVTPIPAAPSSKEAVTAPTGSVMADPEAAIVFSLAADPQGGHAVSTLRDPPKELQGSQREPKPSDRLGDLRTRKTQPIQRIDGPAAAPQAGSNAEPPAIADIPPPPSEPALTLPERVLNFRSLPTQPMRQIDLTAPASEGDSAADPPTVEPKQEARLTRRWSIFFALAALLCGLLVWNAVKEDTDPDQSELTRRTRARDAGLQPAPDATTNPVVAAPSDLATPKTSPAPVAPTWVPALVSPTPNAPDAAREPVKTAPDATQELTMSDCKAQEKKIYELKDKIQASRSGPNDPRLEILYDSWNELRIIHTNCQRIFYVVEMGWALEFQEKYPIAIRWYDHFYLKVKNGERAEDWEKKLAEKRKDIACTKFLSDALRLLTKKDASPPARMWPIDEIGHGWQICKDLGFLILKTEMTCASNTEEKAMALMNEPIANSSANAIEEYTKLKSITLSPCATKILRMSELRFPFPKPQTRAPGVP